MRLTRIIEIVALASVVTACGDKDPQSADQPNEAEKQSPVRESQVSAAGWQLALDRQANDKEWKRALTQDPRGVMERILEIEDPDQRKNRLREFFYHFSDIDPHLARQLLPETMDLHGQQYYAMPVVEALVRIKDVSGAIELLYEKIPGSLQAGAIGNAVVMTNLKSFSPDDVLEVWGLLKDGETKDRLASAIGRIIARKSHLAAIQWFESLEPRVQAQISGDSLAAATAPEILEQMSVAKDPRLLPGLSTSYGKQLRNLSGQPSLVVEELLKLPESSRAAAEIAFLGTLWYRSDPDIDAIKDYLESAVSPEGKDATNEFLAYDEFARSPENGVAMLIDSGILERKPESLTHLLGNWLKVDAASASEYVGNLEAGEARRSGIEATIEYLERIGDKDSANTWREELDIGGEEPIR